MIHEDNNACIAIITTPEQHQRTKHIDVRYYFVWEHVKNGNIKLVKEDTKNMIADALTKPLSRQRQEKYTIN